VSRTPHSASVVRADPCLGCFAAKCSWDETCKPATCVKKPHPGPKRESLPVPRATLPLTLRAACHPKCGKTQECRDGHCIKKYTPPVHQPKSEWRGRALAPLLTRHTECWPACKHSEECRDGKCVRKHAPEPKSECRRGWHGGESTAAGGTETSLTRAAECHPECKHGFECKDGRCVKKPEPVPQSESPPDTVASPQC
jgi:hypothetical protein